MISANVERLMGHSNGLKDSYYKPTENQVLKDYLKMKLEFSDNNRRTQTKNQANRNGR